MIPDKMLDLSHKRLCTAKQVYFSAAPFTNTYILVVCNFYQLCPVSGSPLFVKHNPCDVNDLAPSLWSVFDFMELTQIKRQSYDTEFASLLNKIWIATPQPNSVEDHILKCQEIIVPEDLPTFPNDVMHIYAQNKYAAEHNEKMWNRCPGHLFTFTAKDSIKEQNTRLFNITMPDKYHKTGRLTKTLQIKIGAWVMLTNNINTPDGLTNGAMGTVTHVVGRDVNTTILVKFDNALVRHVAKQNSKYKHIST